jgi:hypothetical protein
MEFTEGADTMPPKKRLSFFGDLFIAAICIKFQKIKTVKPPDLTQKLAGELK